MIIFVLNYVWLPESSILKAGFPVAILNRVADKPEGCEDPGQ